MSLPPRLLSLNLWKDEFVAHREYLLVPSNKLTGGGSAGGIALVVKMDDRDVVVIKDDEEEEGEGEEEIGEEREELNLTGREEGFEEFEGEQ
jgi:hypothetical protein